MRVLWLFSLAVLLAGCGQHESHENQRAALDALLTGSHVKRAEFVDRQHDRTNAAKVFAFATMDGFELAIRKWTGYCVNLITVPETLVWYPLRI
jgi:hypothetical protein